MARSCRGLNPTALRRVTSRPPAAPDHGLRLPVGCLAKGSPAPPFPQVPNRHPAPRRPSPTRRPHTQPTPMAATARGLRPPPLGACCRSWRRVGGHARGRGTGSPGRPCDGRRLPGHSMHSGEGWAPSGMTLVGPGVGARSARGRARTPVTGRAGARSMTHRLHRLAKGLRQEVVTGGGVGCPSGSRSRRGGPAGRTRSRRLPSLARTRPPVGGVRCTSAACRTGCPGVGAFDRPAAASLDRCRHRRQRNPARLGGDRAFSPCLQRSSGLGPRSGGRTVPW
jgi:hypothetical protein